jgi:cysteine-rich repeat protein
MFNRFKLILITFMVLISSSALAAVTITSPSTDSANKSPVVVTYVIDESVQASSVEITWDDGENAAIVFSMVDTLSVNFTFDPSDPAVEAEISSVSGDGDLPDGTYTMTVSYTPSGGGPVVSSSSTDVIIDTVAPNAPSTPDLDADSDTGENDTDNKTSDDTPTFTGTAEANASVRLTSSEDGTLGTTTANESGDWTFTVSSITLSVDQTHEITAVATDSALNQSVSSGALSIEVLNPCPPGRFSEDGFTPCTVCDPGTFTEFSESTSCTECPEGTYQADAGAIECIECPLGTAHALTGQDELSDCTECSPGTIAPVTGSETCTECEAGFSQSESGQITCIECNIGTFSLAGQNVCTSCEVGTFASVTQSESCSDCPAGRFQADEGASTCSLCAAGTFSEAGVGACTACAAGTFSSTAGSASCTSCPEDTFAATAGATECSDCATGTYADAGSSSCSSLCGDGIVAGDEECDDEGTDDLDGCSSTCTEENFTDLSSFNASVNFEALTVSETVTLSAPTSLSSTSASVMLALSSDCECTWTVSPSSVGTLGDSDSCVSSTFTLAATGRGNLQTAITCSDDSQTFNQSFLVSEADTTSSASGGCSLDEQGRESILYVGISLILSMMLIFRLNRSQ